MKSGTLGEWVPFHGCSLTESSAPQHHFPSSRMQFAPPCPCTAVFWEKKVQQGSRRGSNIASTPLETKDLEMHSVICPHHFRCPCSQIQVTQQLRGNKFGKLLAMVIFECRWGCDMISKQVALLGFNGPITTMTAPRPYTSFSPPSW